MKNHSFINSIIGEGTRFSGELELSGLLRIDGDFKGSINTEGKVLVGKTGRAECNIVAGDAVIGGIVQGNIYSTGKVSILSTGMVIGNIQAPRLVVEEGVILHGSYQIVQSSEDQKLNKTKVEDTYKLDWDSPKSDDKRKSW